jgi:hypothetical protein
MTNLMELANEIANALVPAQLFDSVCDYYELTRAQSWDLQVLLHKMGVEI